VNPSKSVVKKQMSSKPGACSLLGQVCQVLMTGQTATCVEGREADAGFCAELQEPVALMPRESPSAKTARREYQRGALGGPIRSSEEGS